jgi:hypothetical protein
MPEQADPPNGVLPNGRSGRLRQVLDPEARGAPSADLDVERSGATASTGRRGFVVTFVANTLIYQDSPAGSPERDAAAAAMRALLPALDEVGVFQVFQPQSEEVRAFVEAELPHVSFPIG